MRIKLKESGDPPEGRVKFTNRDSDSRDRLGDVLKSPTEETEYFQSGTSGTMC